MILNSKTCYCYFCLYNIYYCYELITIVTLPYNRYECYLPQCTLSTYTIINNCNLFLVIGNLILIINKRKERERKNYTIFVKIQQICIVLKKQMFIS